jgi:hypothetical protein
MAATQSSHQNRKSDINLIYSLTIALFYLINASAIINKQIDESSAIL